MEKDGIRERERDKKQERDESGIEIGRVGK